MTKVPGIELGRVLGRGASSTVYLGVQERFGRSVAVKVLQVPGRDEIAARLFATECRTLGRLGSHPDIVTVYDAGTTEDGDPYLVMEHLPGGTLAERLDGEGPLPVDEVLRVGVRLAGALATAHGGGVVHGDVKPQNVLRSAVDLPALADFGIARLRNTTLSSDITTFTPLHAAPELFDGKPPTEATDVYGLGSTLFELLDGTPAAGDDTDSPLAVVGRVARRERRQLDPATHPGALIAVVERAMAYDADDRFGGAAELGAALQEVQRELGLQSTEMVVFDLPAVESTPVGEAVGEVVGEAAGNDPVGEASAEPDPLASSAADDTIVVARRPGAPERIDGLPAPPVPPTPPGRAGGATGDGSGTSNEVGDSGSGGTGSGGSDGADTGPGGRPSSGRRAMLAGVAALLLLLIGFGLAFEWPKGTDDPAGTTTTAQRPTTTEAEHGVGPGLQPDVTYNVKDAPNTTPELDAALADLGPVLAPLGATPVVQTTGFPALESTPATARFQANRGDFDQVKGCAGFLSRPMTLTGQWTRTVVPSADVKVILLVWQFANRAQADEAYVALSLGQNPPAESCRGFSEKWGVDDYDELDVSHQDPPLPGLPQGVRYNSFGGPATPEIPVGHLNAIAQDGDTLVVLTSTASPAHGPLDPAVAAAVMTNVLDRVS